MSLAQTADLPLTETVSPPDAAETAAVVRDAFEQDLATYPLGGCTSLAYGTAGTRPGLGLSLANQTKVVDYPARDMTITVEAGITMAALAEQLATERQWLPVDVPAMQTATIGGVIATDHNGPRRFGSGTMRDYVIGISAVDGRGTLFRGGGRVVKNVAGYDFCKLLTGSMGTLGVITQVTLKVRPIPEASMFVVQPLKDLDQAEQLLSALSKSRTSPSAVEMLAGTGWSTEPALGALVSQDGCLAVGLEGTSQEVEWMARQLCSEWNALGATGSLVIGSEGAANLWRKLTDFASESHTALTMKISVLPSKLIHFLKQLLSLYPACSLQSHAASGIVKVRFSELPLTSVNDTIERVRRTASDLAGRAVVLGCAENGLSRDQVWGPPAASYPVMEAIKNQLDPKGLLNPGRFVFSS